MSDLPAMSSVAQELISLTHSQHSSARQLDETIKNDYSLTNKILQVANSSYYRRGEPVNTVLRAITTIGFDAIRNLALSIAVFNDFLKHGVAKDKIIETLSLAYLSAFFGLSLSTEKNLNIPNEEVFVCTLLSSLGKVIIIVYCPKLYKKVEEVMADGYSEARASKTVLKGLTFVEVGQKMAAHWNFSKVVIESMPPKPTHPKNSADTLGLIHNVTDFSDRIVSSVCNDQKLLLRETMTDYRKLFSLAPQEVAEIFKTAIELSASCTSPEIREGLHKIKPMNKLKKYERIL